MPAFLNKASLPLLLMLSVLLLPIRPDVAQAGGYDVFACDRNHAGGVSPSWWLGADVGHTAYFACPASSHDHGIIARSVWDGQRSGFLQGAYAIFDAPPGTVVESIHASIYIHRPSCDWSVGVYASGYDLGGYGVHHLPAGGYCYANAFGWVRRDLAINQPRVRVEARCGATSCLRGQTYSGGPGTAEARLKDVRVRVRDDQPPAVANPRGSLASGGWVGGVATVGFDANDGAGIREAVIRVDGREIARTVKRCDYMLRAPCPQGGYDTSFETAGIKPDGKHRLTLEAVDTGGNPAQVERDVFIDNTPPGQPEDLSLAGGEVWRAENDFDLTWRNPVEKGVAPVVGAEYELCPSDGGKCTRGQRSGENLTSIKDLKVPAPGEYVLRLWLRDEAGNQDVRTAAQPLRLRFDDFAPDVAFEPLDPADPTLLKIRAVDRGSGVAQAHVEIKARKSTIWRPLTTTIEPQRLTARLDDEYLKDGVYDLRARAVDHASNERTSESRTDGQHAEVTMPIRLKTRLRVGVKRRGARRVRYRSRARVGYGRPARFRGRLMTRDGNPIQDAEVLVFSQARRAGAPMQLVATLKTSRRGGFAYRAPKGVSRTIRFRYAGTGTIRSATRNVAVLVRAYTTIRSHRRAFVNGETMRLRGRLRGRSIPPEGKLVELQVLIRGRWRTFATTRASRRGGWHYDYRFDGTRGRQTYRFRARVPREATYPYETGNSRVVRVRVRGI
jgi:hypothetical protein